MKILTFCLLIKFACSSLDIPVDNLMPSESVLEAVKKVGGTSLLRHLNENPDVLILNTNHKANKVRTTVSGKLEEELINSFIRRMKFLEGTATLIDPISN